MARVPRLTFVLALPTLALAGCGGSGSQPTTLDQNLRVDAVTAYPAGVTAGTSLDTFDDRAVKPLAVFRTTRNDQSLVVWGTRDADGRVVGVRETAFQSDDTKAPLYVQYNSAGGAKALYDSDSESYLTLSDLEDSGNSIVATGVDGTTGKSATVRATYGNGGVTVKELDRATGTPTGKARFVPSSEIAATLAKARAEAAGEPLFGFAGVYKDTAAEGTRTKILTAVFRAAAVLVQDDDRFRDALTDTAGFLLLNQLGDSYASFLNRVGAPDLATTDETSVAYLRALPPVVGE